MKYKLSDICEYAKEKIKISDLDENTYISTENMLPNKSGITQAASLPTQEQTQAFMKNDVLVSNIRPYFKKIWFATFDGGCSNDVLVFRAKNGINSRFLHYVLSDDSFFDYSMATSKGTKMPRGDKKAIMEYEVPKLSYEEQSKIASILEVIDEKIELNSSINKNLEQQARSLFKAWFVDFDPFANTMLSDWKKGKLKDILKLKRQSIKTGENTTLPYLPIDVIPMRTFALTDFKPNAEAQSSLITFDKDDIIIGAMRVYFHRVVLAPCDGITRTTCFTLAPYNNEYLSFALLCCDQESSIDYAQSTSKGSTMPYAIWEGGLGDMEIIIPTPEIAKKFNEIVLPMLRQIQNSYFENNRLREIRDALLPRLMSGEVDVSNLDL
ncbi:MAG: restriction endonuclease subunit S [Lactobacillus iners]|nr:restriction endonuclease subunit S [Lactobacillus iners]